MFVTYFLLGVPCLILAILTMVVAELHSLFVSEPTWIGCYFAHHVIFNWLDASAFMSCHWFFHPGLGNEG